MVTADDLATLVARLENMEARMGNVQGGTCSAGSPHVDGLVFIRGPNHYVCKCTMVYVKGDHGTLKVKV